MDAVWSSVKASSNLSPAIVADSIDARWMRRALALAEKGLYTTDPNPRVGCVLVKDGKLVGEGFHARAGEPHAEVHALAQAGTDAVGATAYVTLEPCSHFGRTPPCADALIAARVARVVVATEDPFPQVSGAGIRRLREAGIEVDGGLLESEARELNIGFHHRQMYGRPFVRLKLGLSLDGRTALADGRSQWITSAAAREDVQYWRARSSAILTGIGSILADDSRLNVRLEPGVAHLAPLRVLVDSAARLPASARLLATPGDILHVTRADARVRPELGEQVERIHCDAAEGRIDLARLMTQLAQRQCNELLVECGARLAGALIEARLVDELLLYVAPKLLGSRARAAFAMAGLAQIDDASRWDWHDIERVGPDLRLQLRPAEPGTA